MISIFKIAYIKNGRQRQTVVMASDIYAAGFIFSTRYPEIPDDYILAIIRGKQVKQTLDVNIKKK